MGTTPTCDEDLARDLITRLNLPLGPSLQVERLGGGVSSIVLRVTDGSRSVIVKQAREQLDVPDVWRANPRRSHVEAEALRLMSAIVPAQVPRVLAEDEARHAIVLDAAPANWSNYKTLLLEGVASAYASREVGALLATWHLSTASLDPIPEVFNRPEALRELRIEPFFLSVARSQPDFAGAVLRAASFLESTGCCLVHGDATPKNVLVSPADLGFWLLDAEVMHFGRPELDVAMWSGHLLIKSHRAGTPAKIAVRALSEFAAAYRGSNAVKLLVQEELKALVAAVVYARLFGMSRVDYLHDVDIDALLATVSNIVKSEEPVLEQLSNMEFFA